MWCRNDAIGVPTVLCGSLKWTEVHTEREVKVRPRRHHPSPALVIIYFLFSPEKLSELWSGRKQLINLDECNVGMHLHTYTYVSL